MTYAAFLAQKKRLHFGDGIRAATLPAKLFDWQAAMARWALRKGRAAIFADCGLGKTPKNRSRTYQGLANAMAEQWSL